MKVIYDISVLGLGHILPRARTGVFRVIENVAGQLLLNPECDVTFCSNSNWEGVSNALSYLESSRLLSGSSFSKPPFFDLKNNLSVRKNELIKIIVNNDPLSSFKKLKAKLEIKKIVALERSRILNNDHAIHPRDVRNAEIYHSPFYPLGIKINRRSYKSFFITCYDIMPILFPQYFEQSIIDLMNAILKSMTPETWVLCISESTRNDLLNYLGNKLNPERVLVTELAASETFYQSTDNERNSQVRRKHHIPEGPYILSLCTFEPRKNINQVIKAFVRIIELENISDLNLVLVGTQGWMFEKIFNEIENNNKLKNRIIVTGFVADEDLAAIYSDAMFFVYPSFYEGFGLPPLEAMKCGIPVITSNVSSMPEVVGDAGLMVSPTDLDALCQAMLLIYKSPSLQHQMSVNSLQRANNFSWKKCAGKTVNAYAASLNI